MSNDKKQEELDLLNQVFEDVLHPQAAPSTASTLDDINRDIAARAPTTAAPAAPVVASAAPAKPQAAPAPKTAEAPKAKAVEANAFTAEEIESFRKDLTDGKAGNDAATIEKILKNPNMKGLDGFVINKGQGTSKADTKKLLDALETGKYDEAKTVIAAYGTKHSGNTLFAKVDTHGLKDGINDNDAATVKTIHAALHDAGISSPQVDEMLKKDGALKYVTKKSVAQFETELKNAEAEYDKLHKLTDKTRDALVKAEVAMVNSGYDGNFKPAPALASAVEKHDKGAAAK